MALDKLVDSAQLDSDLTSVANAIRTKGGTSASLAFPAGFISAVEAIETGGGGMSMDDIMSNNFPSSIVIGDVTPRGNAFSGAAITTVRYNLTGSDNLAGKPAVFGNSSVVTAVMPFFTGTFAANSAQWFANCSRLKTVDWKVNMIARQTFQNSPLFDTLILRSASVVTLSDVSAFNSTCFKSGGTGGTIYIPKALYDHLGDGSALDYKAATNWSTINGYGTVTWAQIEGSVYETHYADGTPVT